MRFNSFLAGWPSRHHFKPRSWSSGSAFIEAVLALPILLVFALVLVDFYFAGTVFFSLNHIAREAVLSISQAPPLLYDSMHPGDFEFVGAAGQSMDCNDATGPALDANVTACLAKTFWSSSDLGAASTGPDHCICTVVAVRVDRLIQAMNVPKCNATNPPATSMCVEDGATQRTIHVDLNLGSVPSISARTVTVKLGLRYRSMFASSNFNFFGITYHANSTGGVWTEWDKF